MPFQEGHQSRNLGEQLVEGDDRYVLQATAALVERMRPEDVARLLRPADLKTPVSEVQLSLAYCLATYREDASGAVRRTVSILRDPGMPAGDRLDALRLLQLALGDLVAPSERDTVWAGYSPRSPQRLTGHEWVTNVLRESFPTGHADLDREARTHGLMYAPDPPRFPTCPGVRRW